MKKFVLVVFLLILPVIAMAWTEVSHFNSLSEGGWSCQSYSAGGTFPGTHYSISAMSSPDPPNVLRWSFPTGFPGNHELGMCWNPFPAEAEEIWVQYYFKFSPNWTVGTGSKLIFILVGGGGNMFTSFTGGSKRFYFTTQTYATNSYPPNVGPQPTMVNGQWYKHTLHLKMNTPGVLNGLVEMWVDDVLTTRYTNVGYRPASQAGRGFFDITLNTGKANVAAGAGEYMLYDYIITSTSPIGTEPPGDPNPPYTDTNSPGKNSTGWPVANRTLSMYYRDFSGVTRSTIGLRIDGGTLLTCASGLTCTPTSTTAPAYLVSYTRGSDWADNTLYTLTTTATDIYSNSLNESYTFRTALAAPAALNITTSSLPDGKVGDVYSSTVVATGGVSPYTWDSTTPLPSGLNVSPNTGAIIGVPTVTWTDNVTIRVTDSVGTTDTQSLSLTIDPADAYDTEGVGTPSDTFLNKGSPSTNSSSADRMWIYTWPENEDANRGLIKWDLSDIPAGSVPTKATLRLFVTGFDGAGGDNTYSVTIHRITGVNPTISAATWGTYNGTTAWTGGTDGGYADMGAAEATVDIDKTPRYYNVDITAMVKEWLISPSSNKGLIINPPDLATVDSNRQIAAVEHPVLAYRPALFLTYATQPSKSMIGGILTGGVIE